MVGDAAFERAARAAVRNGTHVHAEILASGVVSTAAYVRSLAVLLDAPCLMHIDRLAEVPARDGGAPAVVHAVAGGASLVVVDATSDPPGIVAARVEAVRISGQAIALAPRAAIMAALEAAGSAAAIDTAVHGLKRTAPESSAAGPWRPWQYVLPALVVGLVGGGAFVLPAATAAVASGVIAVPFLAVTVLRLLALREVLRRAPRGPAPRRSSLPPPALPSYSVLVPLFREAGVIPDLVRALDALDYPRTKLEVLLLIESIDLETQAALLALQLPPHFRIVHVPDCFPRTKPKALNYALAFARGDLVVVYDAEDRPQPSQLRLAADLFARAPTDVACLQARLNIYNPGESWFARQFTIEYSALFDAVLPALASLRLPIPLGGTSNHFRRAALLDLQGWDPFNVTEDADLGIRLARSGTRTLVLASTTWEEAPVAFPVWLRQRTRWIKGWMQTLLVHTREPSALRRDLGLLGALGVYAVLGGLIFSALAQPWFLMLVAYQIASGEFFAPPETLWSTFMISICWANLTIGYLVSMVVGFLSTWRRGRKRLALEALMMPAYWLLISFAAHRALYQLVREPYLWEKTPHGVSRRKGRTRRPVAA
jgi:cellulose synthase/poly-beta-1,6-N-acetylglucosamine synthase-like glycosyltransferase